MCGCSAHAGGLQPGGHQVGCGLGEQAADPDGGEGGGGSRLGYPREADSSVASLGCKPAVPGAVLVSAHLCHGELAACLAAQRVLQVNTLAQTLTSTFGPLHVS